MTDTYKDAKEQLDGIVEQVRKKDVSLEKSLDLLEEGVALANRCTELIDQAAWEEAEDTDGSDESSDPDAIDDVDVADTVDIADAATGNGSGDSVDSADLAIDDEGTHTGETA